MGQRNLQQHPERVLHSAAQKRDMGNGKSALLGFALSGQPDRPGLSERSGPPTARYDRDRSSRAAASTRCWLRRKTSARRAREELRCGGENPKRAHEHCASGASVGGTAGKNDSLPGSGWEIFSMQSHWTTAYARALRVDVSRAKGLLLPLWRLQCKGLFTRSWSHGKACLKLPRS